MDAEFEQWVHARGAALARSAYLLTGDVHLAEDLVQDTLVRVASRWRRLDDRPDGYARTVMHHLAVDRWRRRRSRPDEVLTHAPPEAGGGDGADEADRRLLLRRALLQLTPRERAVVSLRFYEDLTEVETARVLGCSTSTVKSQTRVALARLRDVAPALLDDLTDHPTTDAGEEARR
ncbi:SigE family RNA polymerase sigma factor [Nocardioides flavescens]|uniref:SigE family RNA polymerase sigma factor n=1 Tax=Nocardioides flavescens TaxID=2691959 RepID=A0A6L7EX59_9ACTN|nr:SigE family RNA polymerase sigma factor [Nocardioides flavescens]